MSLGNARYAFNIIKHNFKHPGVAKGLDELERAISIAETVREEKIIYTRAAHVLSRIKEVDGDALSGESLVLLEDLLNELGAIISADSALQAPVQTAKKVIRAKKAVDKVKAVRKRRGK